MFSVRISTCEYGILEDALVRRLPKSSFQWIRSRGLELSVDAGDFFFVAGYSFGGYFWFEVSDGRGVEGPRQCLPADALAGFPTGGVKGTYGLNELIGNCGYFHRILVTKVPAPHP